MSKKNKSAYLYFCEDERIKIKQDNNIDSKKIMSELAIRWKLLKEKDTDRLKYYENLAIQDKNRYLNEKKEGVIPTETIKKKEEKKKEETPKKVNGYIVFCKKNRQNFKKSNPELGPKEITKKLAESWKELSEDEKESYRN
jgi:hypothetical protein